MEGKRSSNSFVTIKIQRKYKFLSNLINGSNQKYN